MTKTIVALFNDYDDAQAAVNELLRAGFARNDISLVAHNADGALSAGHAPAGTSVATEALAGAGEGAVLGGLTGLAAGIITLLLPGLGPVLAFGPLAAALTGAGMGAVGGGVIGGLAGLGISEEDAGYYAEGIRQGGTLVAVHADDMRAEDARIVLDQAGAVNIEGERDRFASPPAMGEPHPYRTATLDPDDLVAEDELVGDTSSTTGTLVHTDRTNY